MADAEPTVFKVKEPDGIVRFDEIALHRVFETDKAGKTRVHVWVTGQAKTADEAAFHSISADVAFSLFDGNRLLGICTKPGLIFKSEDEPVAVVADDGLYIESHESVTKIEVQIETSKVVRASTKLHFDPS